MSKFTVHVPSFVIALIVSVKFAFCPTAIDWLCGWVRIKGGPEVTVKVALELVTDPSELVTTTA